MFPLEKSLSERVKCMSQTKKKMEREVFISGELKLNDPNWKRSTLDKDRKQKLYQNFFLSHSVVANFMMENHLQSQWTLIKVDMCLYLPFRIGQI